MSSRPSSSPETGLAGDQELQTAALEDLGAAPTYQSWLCHLASGFLGDDPVELESGNRDYPARWLDDGLERVTLTEDRPIPRAVLERRFEGDARVTIGTVGLEPRTRRPIRAWCRSTSSSTSVKT